MTAVNLLVDAIILVALPLNWIVTALLWRVSLRSPDVGVLRERAGAALAVSLILTVFTFVFLNNDLDDPILQGDDLKIVTRSVMLVLSVVPALLWLRLYRSAR